MKFTQSLFLFALLLITHLACAQDRTTRKVSSFTKVQAGGSLNVVLEQGKGNNITIESKGIDQDKIKTEVKGETLHIYMERGNHSYNYATVYVTYQELEEISNSGSGDLLCKSDLRAATFIFNNSGSGNATCHGQLKAKKVSVDLSGSGNVALNSLEAEEADLSMSGSGNLKASSGMAKKLTVNKSGSGNLEAPALITDVCSVKMSGSGNVEIVANEVIEAGMSGSGNIQYRGNATVRKVHSSGSGEIIRN